MSIWSVRSIRPASSNPEDITHVGGQTYFTASRAGEGVLRPEHLPESIHGQSEDHEDLQLKPAVRAFRLRYVQRVIDVLGAFSDAGYSALVLVE